MRKGLMLLAFLGVMGFGSGCALGAKAPVKADPVAAHMSGENAAETESSVGAETAGEAVSDETAGSGESDGFAGLDGLETADLEKIPSEPVKTPEGLWLFVSLPVEGLEKPWLLELYASAEAGEDGMLLDDQNRFLIRAVSGEDAFVFLDESIQMGVPEAAAFFDEEGGFHVVLTNAMTAQYRIMDYRYDPAENSFYGKPALDYSGINYFGKVEPVKTTSAREKAGIEKNTETICGYLKKLDKDSVEIDRVEYRTDNQEILPLGPDLEGVDFFDEYEIFNETENVERIPLADGVSYEFIDWGRDFVESDLPEDVNIKTTTQAVFQSYLKTYTDGSANMPFFYDLEDGKIIRIWEYPMP